MNNPIIFSGNSSKLLAEEVCKELGLQLGKAKILEFSDGETRVELLESVRKKDVFVIQSTCNPVNNNLMELLLMIDALKRASAQSIAAVIPYFGYSRQDHLSGIEPISAKLVADFIALAGATHVVSVDLHSPQIQGFFEIPCENLSASSIFCNYFKKKNLSDLTVVSPDLGGVKRARVFSNQLNASLAIIEKNRPKPNESEAINLIGSVKGRTAVLFDDIIDTGGTIVNAANFLLEREAKEVYACCTHGVLSGNACERLKQSEIKEVITTNSIPFQKNERKIVQLSLAPLLSKEIKKIHEGENQSQVP